MGGRAPPGGAHAPLQPAVWSWGPSLPLGSGRGPACARLSVLQAHVSREPGPQHHLRPWSGAPLHLPSPGVGFAGPRALLPSHLEAFEAQDPFWSRGAGPGQGRSLSLELHLGLGVILVWTQLTHGRGAHHVWSDMCGARFSLPPSLPKYVCCLAARTQRCPPCPPPGALPGGASEPRRSACAGGCWEGCDSVGA